MNKVKYEDVKHIIQEGDVLLFRGNTWTSYFLGIAGYTNYIHVAIASWYNRDKGLLECVEFKEWIGGRTTNLSVIVRENPELIDVYRPTPSIISHYFKHCTLYETVKTFDGPAITNTMRHLTGLPYGWSRIWWMAQYHIPFLRMFSDINITINDEVKDIIYPVCSTAVAYAFSSTSYDLVNNRSDDWTEPGDIARSKLLSYLFTLY